MATLSGDMPQPRVAPTNFGPKYGAVAASAPYFLGRARAAGACPNQWPKIWRRGRLGTIFSRGSSLGQLRLRQSLPKVRHRGQFGCILSKAHWGANVFVSLLLLPIVVPPLDHMLTLCFTLLIYSLYCASLVCVSVYVFLVSETYVISGCLSSSLLPPFTVGTPPLYRLLGFSLS